MLCTLRRAAVTLGGVILVGLVVVGGGGGSMRVRAAGESVLPRVATVTISGVWQFSSTDSMNAHLAHFTLHLTQTGAMLTGYDPKVGPLRGTVHGEAVSFTVHAVSVEDGYSCQGHVGPRGLNMAGRIVDNLGGGGVFVAHKV